MSYHTPDGWRERATFVDKRLPHQIRIDTRQRGGSPHLIVRCICSSIPLAVITTAEEALQIFHAHERRWLVVEAVVAGELVAVS